MAQLAADRYRVERLSSDEPIGRRHKLARAIGTAATGLPIPGKRVRFEATLQILDADGTVVYAKLDEATVIDSLELQILQDLIRLDVETFRQQYGLPEVSQ